MARSELKGTLGIAITAARGRGEALDHILLHGNPGLGKTTLAHIIAQEMGAGLRTTSGPVIERPGDLAALLTNQKAGDVLFIDEIHRLPHVVEEVLYPAMEDFKLDLIIGQGPGARALRLDLPRFTLVGATTRAGLLTPALRDRFGLMLRLEFYHPDHLQAIVSRSARWLYRSTLKRPGPGKSPGAPGAPPASPTASCKRVRDFAQVYGDGRITRANADAALTMLEVDHQGFDRMDRRILQTIIEKFDGGPVGVDTLAAALCEERDTLEDVYEPFLIQCGFLNRTPRGRVATRLALEYFDRKPKKPKQPVLEF